RSNYQKCQAVFDNRRTAFVLNEIFEKISHVFSLEGLLKIEALDWFRSLSLTLQCLSSSSRLCCLLQFAHPSNVKTIQL
ncbi:MAG: hypothetical protein V7727_22365, partial [Sneathiella sp.]